MLNLVRYRTAWLVAAVALIIMPLTLRAAPSAGSAGTAPSVDIKTLSDSIASLRLGGGDRSPGSVGDDTAARFIREQLGSEARSQKFSARTPSGPVELENIYVVERGEGGGQGRAPILVVAPRDAPAGVTGGVSGSALLIALAKVARTTRHNRPIFFLSSDGSTLGNAGIRLFLARNKNIPFAAAVVLDGPAEARGNGLHLWMAGSEESAAPAFRQIAADAARRANIRVAPANPFWSQMLRLAVPQSIGDQGPIITANIPAVTLSARPETPLRADATAIEEVSPERLGLVSNAAQNVISFVDGATRVPRPSGSVLITGRIMRPITLRLTLLIALVPILVVAGDLVVRLRRERIFLGRGLRALRWHMLAPAAALLAGNVLTIAGLFPEGAAGRPPLADVAGFDWRSALGVFIVAAAAFIAWRFARPRVRDAEALPPTDAAAAFLTLAVALVVTWVVDPYTLIVTLPAAHAAVLATVDRKRWQGGGLVAMALLPFLLMVWVIGDLVNASTFPAFWYLVVTTFAGTRGLLGPALALVVGVCIWVLVVPALARRTPRPPMRSSRSRSAQRRRPAERPAPLG